MSDFTKVNECVDKWAHDINVQSRLLYPANPGIGVLKNIFPRRNSN